MTTDIIHVEPQLTELAISPESFQQAVDDAAAKARILSEIVESQKLYTMMGPSKHLQVEAWETIAKGYGCTAAVRTSEILYTPDGVEVGAKAYAVVYDQNGVVRGSAEGYCMRDERNWGTKPIFQLISMAGTRAVSKSLRLMFSWVVVLAGYSPTPAEEMIHELQGRPAPAPPPAQRRPQRKAPKSSPEKMEELNEARLDDDGDEVYTPDEINNYIAANYAERDARDLSTAEINEVIAAVKDGNIK